jgi:hypothetical protein
MAYIRSIQDKTEEEYNEEEEEKEEDDIYNDVPFKDISPDCKKLVLEVKRKLYNSIIFGPDLKSKDAQNNDLLLIYLKMMMKLYQICIVNQNQTVKEDKLQKQLLVFPMETRDIIFQLVNWESNFFRTNQYVDTIPYTDYFDIHFRKHPLLQK